MNLGATQQAFFGPPFHFVVLITGHYFELITDNYPVSQGDVMGIYAVYAMIIIIVDMIECAYQLCIFDSYRCA
ncbi:MAG: hypothetical protein V7739_09795 [Motiliproteus sp.]